MPCLELVEAVVAGARRSGTRVEVGVLIERHNIARVPVAEDIATTAAVVTADEVAEVAFASRVIADGRLGVGLQGNDD